jgi:hypothetical protein
MNYQSIITIEPGKRGGRPCIRRMRIAVADVLGWLAAGNSAKGPINARPKLVFAKCALVLTGIGLILGTSRVWAFEQDQRINGLTLQFGTDTFATKNALGGAVASSVQPQLQAPISAGVASGATSLLFEMPGLTDLTGVNEPPFNIGVVNAAPIIPTNNPATYSGTSDLDWWYLPSPSDLDKNGHPKNQMSASISAKVLTGGPGEIIFGSSPLSGSGYMEISSAFIKASVGNSSAPLRSTNNFPPGYLSSEDLDPSLVSFASMTAGKLKGNVSAASLASMPVSLSITTDQGYTSTNSLLDVLVSGATYLGGLIRLITPTQPDQVDPNAPMAGAGPPYTFSADASKKVTTCKDKNGTVVNLSAGLAAAAYSAYFTFTTDRVIDKSVLPPTLGITVESNTVTLSWSTDAIGFSLQYATNLPATNWTPVLPVPSIVNSQFTVTNTIGGSVFYRLTK